MQEVSIFLEKNKAQLMSEDIVNIGEPYRTDFIKMWVNEYLKDVFKNEPQSEEFKYNNKLQKSIGRIQTFQFEVYVSPGFEVKNRIVGISEIRRKLWRLTNMFPNYRIEVTLYPLQFNINDKVRKIFTSEFPKMSAYDKARGAIADEPVSY